MTLTLDITATIALWGALTGTAAIVWDIIKWWADSPRLEVSVNPNMQIVNPKSGDLEPKKLILVRVVNVGKRSTKVTCLLGLPFKTRIHRLFGKPASHGFISMTPLADAPLPLVLQPGDDWTGFLNQEEAFQIAGNLPLYCGVQHTLAKKPVLARINFGSLRPLCEKDQNRRTDL